jgi:hypothetical protein
MELLGGGEFFFFGGAGDYLTARHADAGLGAIGKNPTSEIDVPHLCPRNPFEKSMGVRRVIESHLEVTALTGELVGYVEVRCWGSCSRVAAITWACSRRRWREASMPVAFSVRPRCLARVWSS